MKIHIRAAQKTDAPLLAQIFVYAIGEETAVHYCGANYIEVLTAICESEGTQYSYRHALVGECDGRPVAGIIGYDGAQLHALREGTLSIIRQHNTITASPEDETTSGEFYIDSIGVHPAFRGLGIGRRLLAAMCHQATEQGHRCVGLLVDQENPNAERLYLSLGFEHKDMRTFFGHKMKHLVWQADQKGL